MYPLLQLGPLRLSTGGLLLLAAAFVWQALFARAARARVGAPLAEQAESLIFPAILGAILGGRLWYAAFNWDLYGAQPALLLALRVGDFAWPGALLGGLLAGWLWCRYRRYDAGALADAAALALPPAQAIGWVGMLLSGEGFGAPSDLPWAIVLFGAPRHPTQLYNAVAALLLWAWLRRLRALPPGGVLAAYLGGQGLALLLLEALRGDSLLLPGGVRAGQVAGLLLMLAALAWARHASRPAATPAPEPPSAG